MIAPQKATKQLASDENLREPGVGSWPVPSRQKARHDPCLGINMKFTSARMGNKEITLSNVTVFLGANGAGKSSVLNDAKAQVQNICPGKKVVYVEGGRTINLKNTLQLNRQNVDQYQDFTRAKSTYEQKRQNSLSDRVYDALMMLERKELAIKASHSDAVQAWVGSDQNYSCPTREQPPLEKLFALFHEIFPRLSIEYDPNTKNINVKKGANKYPISGMSDGEKQAFSILADFVELDDEYGLIIVDEPELNLHPELADRIWNLIESEFPGKVYCYATHSLSFAMRPQVERIVVLSDDPDNITEVTDLSDFSTSQLSEFLGSIPGIISASKVIVTEGNEKSFDSIFYRWILVDDQIEIMPAGDCEQVINVCRRDGIWSKIAPKVSLVGIVDRDFRNSSAAEEIHLPLREAESYLGIPKLAVSADKHMSIKPNRLNENLIIEIILSHLESERHLIYANTVAANCGIRLGVSVAKSVLRDCQDKSSLLVELKASSQAELAKATESLGDDKIEALISATEEKIDQIIESKDWLGGLTLIDGKKIGAAIANMIGVRNPSDLMRSIAANIDFSDIQEVYELSCSIAEKFPQNSSSR